MTKRQAKLLALKVARNYPTHAMGIIARYVYWKMEQRQFPYHTEPGEAIMLVDMLQVEQDLRILLLYNHIDWKPLKVGMRDGDLCVSFKGLDDTAFLKDLTHRDALHIVYTT